MSYPEFPAMIPARNKIILIQPTFGFESAFTGVNQTVYHPGARWELAMTFPVLQDYQARILSAFLNGLQGRAGVCKVYDDNVIGKPALGAPAVTGDGQTGRSLNTTGWIPDTLVMNIGDTFTVNDEYKECSEEIWSDINGNATLKFNPPLRKSPPNSAAIETERPYILAKLDMDGVSRANMNLHFSEFDELKFREVIYK